MEKSLRILVPCGMLGYGYPISSFQMGLEYRPDAIVVDAGSTDAGPHKLGKGVAIVSEQACEKDLRPMLTAGRDRNIPVIISSAGGSGAARHIVWTLRILKKILKEIGYFPRIAVITADIPKETVKMRLREGRIFPMSPGVGELTEEKIDAASGIVGQMGHEPIEKALGEGAMLIVCGRAYDPAPFAALASFHRLPLSYGYHAGKILECAALCAVPGTTKDSMLGEITPEGFSLLPLSNKRRCTSLSVAAHTFYEKSHPYLLPGPGYTLDLSECSFEERPDKTVFVKGSRIEKEAAFRIKLEGAGRTAFRTIVIAGIRDPLLIAQIKEVEAEVKAQVEEYYGEVPRRDYRIRFLNYGLDGVMGEREGETGLPHELGLVIDVCAKTQDLANAVCATVRSGILHFGYESRKSTAGNLAFPFAPSDIPCGPVYAFTVYHLMEADDPCRCFPLHFVEASRIEDFCGGLLGENPDGGEGGWHEEKTL